MPVGQCVPRDGEKRDGGGRDGSEDVLATGEIVHTAISASRGMALRQNTSIPRTSL